MLNVYEVKNAAPREKPYKLFDSRGLYLLVNPNGSRLWRYKYRFNGREKCLALGSFPDVRLSVARDKRDAARAMIVQKGLDPSAQRKAEKIARKLANAGTFKAIGEEWLRAGCPGSRRSKGRPSNETLSQLRNRLEKYVYPSLGNRPIKDITLQDLRAVLTAIERRGRHETAHRVRSLCERIYRYAIFTERAEVNTAANLKGVLAPANCIGFAAITEPKQFGVLLNAIDQYDGQPGTMAALKLAPLVFVRPIELRAAQWSEFDLAAKRWSIPDLRMKEGRPHVVPLSNQAVRIISDLQKISGPSSYLFPSLRSSSRPMSNNTLNAAMRRLGFTKDEMTVHGFRKSASTLLHELGFAPDLIETQLAHKRPGVAGIYNKSHLLKERKQMMQAWADFLDDLKK